MTTSPSRVACRLSAILAREAPVAAIFRRGPSKLVELIKWHTDTDTFERGQWFKGRIYESCSDLSPDGSLLIYFTAKLQLGSRFDEDHFPAWTAISRPPWLTALALRPSPGVSVVGGGLFIDDKTVSLSGYPTHPHKDHKPHGLRIVTDPYQHVATIRFTRDGWVRTKSERAYVWERTDKYRWMTIVAEGSPLPEHSYGFGDYAYDCSLIDKSRGTRTPLEEVTWADWDQRGRLVFSRHGKLFAGEFNAEGCVTPRELADLNGDTFEPRLAPAWAREW
jgi:hypothetical protein